MSETAGPRFRKWLVVAGIAAIAVLPPAAWRLSMGPSLSALEVRSILSAPGGNAVLVDVRTPGEYAGGHAEGSVSWPLEEIRRASAADVPAALRGRRLLMLCEAGIRSGEAARRARGLGLDAWNVEGGLEAWRGGQAPPGCALEPGPGGGVFPFRESPAFEQWVAVLSGFAIKPAYMLLSLLLAVLLWRRREADLEALRWSMVAFFAGELACYLNFFLYRDSSRFTEYLHSYGMAVAFGFGVYALFEALDRRVFGFSDPAEKCALVGLCRPCAKYGEARCGLVRLFLWTIFFAFLLSFIPLTAGPHPVAYETRIFGTLYAYEHPLAYQLFEIRLCPIRGVGVGGGGGGGGLGGGGGGGVAHGPPVGGAGLPGVRPPAPDAAGLLPGEPRVVHLLGGGHGAHGRAGGGRGAVDLPQGALGPRGLSFGSRPGLRRRPTWPPPGAARGPGPGRRRS